MSLLEEEEEDVRPPKWKEEGRLRRLPTLGVLCFMPAPGRERCVEEEAGEGVGERGPFSGVLCGHIKEGILERKGREEKKMEKERR